MNCVEKNAHECLENHVNKMHCPGKRPQTVCSEDSKGKGGKDPNGSVAASCLLAGQKGPLVVKTWCSFKLVFERKIPGKILQVRFVKILEKIVHKISLTGSV
jgi:hypothetical protein